MPSLSIGVLTSYNYNGLNVWSDFFNYIFYVWGTVMWSSSSNYYTLINIQLIYYLVQIQMVDHQHLFNQFGYLLT